MKVLGISAFYHDSAAALIINGEISGAAQEERFTRKKQDSSFPKNAIEYLLEDSGLKLNDLDSIVFYDKPLLKFERLIETYYGFAPKGIKSFLKAIPVWLKEKMFLKKLIKDQLELIDSEFNFKKCKLLFPEHHLSHASSAFYPSSFESAAILTLDGVGEWATASIGFGDGSSIKVLKELHFPHSIGLLYSSFTYFLGFKVNSGEYKLMGLAPYGDLKAKQTTDFIKIIKSNLIEIKEDGSIWLDQNYFTYATGLKMVNETKWEKLFGVKKRDPESKLLQVHCNLGLAIQTVTEEIIIKMAKEAKRLTKSNYLCLSGGVALNCVANGKLQFEKIFKEIFIQPAAGDAGGALGAAYAGNYLFFNQNRRTNKEGDSMKGSYLGPEYNSSQIARLSNTFGAKYKKYNSFDEIAKKTAKLISEGNAIGWFQGRMEFGPRALGNRSIIGDARNPEMQKKLNLKIKYRESFRPFAPSVLNEDCSKYFNYNGKSPYMLLVHPVNESISNAPPANYSELNLKEKLYYNRSTVPAVTHVDYSARIQTVHKETNKRYWNLINEFKQLTGCGLIVNTSFNVRSEPIVCSPEDAYKCLMRTEMDYLVMGDFIFSKGDQPNWQEDFDWKSEFELD